jgi:hypothetical protein
MTRSARKVLCWALHEESHDLAYMLMHYDFFSTKGKQVITAWVASEAGQQFWRGILASCSRKSGFSAILEIAVVAVLYLSYEPFRHTTRSVDEDSSPMEELIPFLNNLSEKRRQHLLVSLGYALLYRIGVDDGQACSQLINLLYDRLPKSHDQRPAEDACVWLINDIGQRGIQSMEAFMSNQISLQDMTTQRRERRRSTGDMRKEGV